MDVWWKRGGGGPQKRRARRDGPSTGNTSDSPRMLALGGSYAEYRVVLRRELWRKEQEARGRWFRWHNTIGCGSRSRDANRAKLEFTSCPCPESFLPPTFNKIEMNMVVRRGRARLSGAGTISRSKGFAARRSDSQPGVYLGRAVSTAVAPSRTKPRGREHPCRPHNIGVLRAASASRPADQVQVRRLARRSTVEYSDGRTPFCKAAITAP